MAGDRLGSDEPAGRDPAGVRALLEISGAMAHGDPAAIRDALARAARHAHPSEIEEAILQAYLFLGYPAALNTFAFWREIVPVAPPPAHEAGEREDAGSDGVVSEAGPSTEHGSSPEDGPAEWEARGEGVCRIVYGGQYERLRANVRRLHPDMEHWMVVEGYGKVLGRPGLELKVRELCIVVILAVQGAPRQLYSHLRGALNAGAHGEEIESALSVARRWQSRESSETARQVWSEVQGRGR